MLLYIDPGTGSMLFAVLLGVLSSLAYAFTSIFMKIKYRVNGGKKQAANSNLIPLVIFSDDKRYWQVFEPICRELDARGFDTVYMTASPDDPALENSYEHINAEFIGENNRAFSKLNFLRAAIVLSTTPGLDVYQWKRSKEVKCYVHIPHMASEISLYRMFGTDYYDAMLLSGQVQADEIRALEKLRSLPEKELELVGIPYMDEMVKRLEDSPSLKSSKKTVLLAPSWGKSSIFGRFGGRIIDALLETDYHIIIRPHPQSFKSEAEMLNELMSKYPESSRLEWNRDNDNFDVLRKADILISDFSGVTFDFSLVYDKPIIYAETELDISPYDAWWLDGPLWHKSALPRLGERLDEDNLSRLSEIIESCLNNGKYASGREEVRQECWSNYGNGAAKAADFLINKYNELCVPKGGE